MFYTIIIHKMTTLLFYPSDFNLQHIIKYVEDEIDTLTTLDKTYKVFNYNSSSVEEQQNVLSSRSNGRNLSIVLDFIKNYVNNNQDKQFYIYLYTDGYSNTYKDINISDYISNNIIKFKYINIENKYNLGKLDYNNNWKSNNKFIYISTVKCQSS